MFPRRSWTLVLLPNLILFISYGYPRNNPQPFDEGYLAKNQQLWIKYKGKESSHFYGIWATRFEQKQVTGIRQGSSFLFHSGNRWWKAQLNETNKNCELVLEIENDLLEGKEFLKANFCKRSPQRNQFF